MTTSKQTPKLSQDDLRLKIRSIVREQLAYKDVLPGADGGFAKYAEKVDDLIEEFIDKAETLYQEGVDMMKPDITGTPNPGNQAVGERNRYISARVGALKALRGNLVQLYERLRREV